TVSVAPPEGRSAHRSGVSAVIRDPGTGQAFAGNQIPAARISPIARAILGNTSLYPLPNRSVGSVSGNYVGDALTTTRAHQGDARVDWNATAKDKVFGRISISEYTSSNNKRPF